MSIEWETAGEANDWVMPRAPLWKRLPIVRHVRGIWHSLMIERHESMWRSLGALPSGYDRWVVWGIFHGKERA